MSILQGRLCKAALLKVRQMLQEATNPLRQPLLACHFLPRLCCVLVHSVEGIQEGQHRPLPAAHEHEHNQEVRLSGRTCHSRRRRKLVQAPVSMLSLYRMLGCLLMEHLIFPLPSAWKTALSLSYRTSPAQNAGANACRQQSTGV